MNKTNPRTKHLVTVDAIIINKSKIALIQRHNEPFKGMWALPGGFVDENEPAKHACIREAFEETGLEVTTIKISDEYSSPDRDPRGFTISLVFLCSVKKGTLKAGDDAKNAQWFSLYNLPPMAFDHKKMIDDCLSSAYLAHHIIPDLIRMN